MMSPNAPIRPESERKRMLIIDTWHQIMTIVRTQKTREYEALTGGLKPLFGEQRILEQNKDLIDRILRKSPTDPNWETKFENRKRLQSLFFKIKRKERRQRGDEQEEYHFDLLKPLIETLIPSLEKSHPKEMCIFYKEVFLTARNRCRECALSPEDIRNQEYLTSLHKVSVMAIKNNRYKQFISDIYNGRLLLSLDRMMNLILPYLATSSEEKFQENGVFFQALYLKMAEICKANNDEEMKSLLEILEPKISKIMPKLNAFDQEFSDIEKKILNPLSKRVMQLNTEKTVSSEILFLICMEWGIHLRDERILRRLGTTGIKSLNETIGEFTAFLAKDISLENNSDPSNPYPWISFFRPFPYIYKSDNAFSFSYHFSENKRQFDLEFARLKGDLMETRFGDLMHAKENESNFDERSLKAPVLERYLHVAKNRCLENFLKLTLPLKIKQNTPIIPIQEYSQFFRMYGNEIFEELFLRADWLSQVYYPDTFPIEEKRSADMVIQKENSDVPECFQQKEDPGMDPEVLAAFNRALTDEERQKKEIFNYLYKTKILPEKLIKPSPENDFWINETDLEFHLRQLKQCFPNFELFEANQAVMQSDDLESLEKLFKTPANFKKNDWEIMVNLFKRLGGIQTKVDGSEQRFEYASLNGIPLYRYDCTINEQVPVNQISDVIDKPHGKKVNQKMIGKGTKWKALFEQLGFNLNVIEQWKLYLQAKVEAQSENKRVRATL